MTTSATVSQPSGEVPERIWIQPTESDPDALGPMWFTRKLGNDDIEYLRVSAIVDDHVLRERLAALCHEQWSGWMRYLFEHCSLIPETFAIRWKRQMNTTYSDLPENEKDSDRQEANRVLVLLQQHVRAPSPDSIAEKAERATRRIINGLPYEVAQHVNHGLLADIIAAEFGGGSEATKED
jgi:hypothetical protein